MILFHLLNNLFSFFPKLGLHYRVFFMIPIVWNSLYSMSNSSDSSFSFQKIKRHHQFEFPIPPNKKLRKNTVKKALVHIKTLGLPLISASTGQFCESLCLEPDKPYTAGRKLNKCDFVFADRRVSKRHCQLYYDSTESKIYLSDGLFIDYSRCNGSFSDFRGRVSTNGAFVNGVRISGVVELRVGDVVCLACGSKESCGSGANVGFLVQKVVFVEEVDCRSLTLLNLCGVNSEQTTLGCCRVVDNTSLLLSWCRDIICNDDPVSYIRKFVFLNRKKRIDLSFRNGLKRCSGMLWDNGFEFSSSGGIQIGCLNRKRMYSRGVEIVENSDGKSLKEIVVASEEYIELECSKIVTPANANTAVQICSGDVDNQQTAVSCNSSDLSLGKKDYSQCTELLDQKVSGGCMPPPGKKFYLNRLQFRSEDIGTISEGVSLPELFHPIESLNRVFIATFTSDILWFLTYCKIPPHLPVTIACHSTERCWSSDTDKRTSVPFSDFPNLTVVYPLFPENIAFNNDRKNSGIGCHHPKLFVLQRKDRLRVIITSANLVEKQWRNVTNTVWWQDFSKLNIPNCLSLFTQLSVGEINLNLRCDFAAQLAGFMACLVADVPSQAHWILELIKYDFEGADGYLVASVPGIHSHRSLYVYESKNHLVGTRYMQKISDMKLLSSVEVSVVGLSHIYRASADSSGEHLKKLALFLGKCHENMDGMTEIVLRREINIPADGNAVSVLVPNPEDSALGDFVQLGFLPRNVAKWVAPLSDAGLFAFSAYIHPKEFLATALEGTNKKVKLILYVYTGPSFSTISQVAELEYVSAVCSLVASSQRYAGLWRLREILGRYKWPEHLESEFFFGSSSVGCVNAQFLAAFSAAAGKKSSPLVDSEESDPDWGCWSASQELKNPSIKIVFPSIKRMKNNRSGIVASRRILSFSQKTWQRLENVGILCDAIPYPSERDGFSMHVKVGRRRFLSKNGSSFGWVYCGSHNFSAAAWGRPISDKQPNGSGRRNSVLGSRLHISNYELGIIFIVPPLGTANSVKQNIGNLDDIVLPFVVPPPKYGSQDKPATAQAIREALTELPGEEIEINEGGSAIAGDWLEEEITEQEDEEVLGNGQFVTQEKEDEKAYADELWSQIDSSPSC